jgi:hypothetical protein
MIRTVGGCALAALALSAIGATGASAAEYPLTGLPEIGRCVKVPPMTGHFNLSNCIGVDKDGNDGQYNWEPGPGEKGTFKAHLASAVFETVGGGKISCSGAFLTGEYTDGKGVKVSKTILQGCLNVKPNKICFSNIVTPGTVESNQVLVGKIGFIPNPKNEANPFVAVDLTAEPESLPLLMFNCGEQLGAESIAFEGSVIGRLKYLNKMITGQALLYSQKAGHQLYESFKGGVKDTLTQTTTLVSNPLSKTSEQAGLSGAGEDTNGELIEIKAKQH